MKKAILWLSVVAIVCDILFVVLFIGAAASAASSCGVSATSTQVAQTGCANGGIAGAGIGLLFLVIGLIVALVAWIMGLIKTAQVGAWGWFVLVFLISPLGSLIYGIAGPDQKKVAEPMGAYPGQR